jgi:hypothetical protein
MRKSIERILASAARALVNQDLTSGALPGVGRVRTIAAIANIYTPKPRLFFKKIKPNCQHLQI